MRVLRVWTVTLAVLIVVVAGCGSSNDAPPPAEATVAATPAATPCTEAKTRFGSPPDGFKYERVTEQTRQKTMQALGLDDSGGKVDMRAVNRGGLTLGTLVGVPREDPGESASEVVANSQRDGATVAQQSGYVLLTLRSGTAIAVGPRGCRVVMISAQDPTAVPFIAANVFS